MIDQPQTDARPDFGFNPVTNCWRVARAAQLALIVDGEHYFKALRPVMIAARHELLLIGWDFDFEIEMLPGQSDADGMAPDGLPNHLGDFVEAVVERSPELHLYLLKWNGALLVAPGRLVPTEALRIFGSERIHFALDGHHPFGACHHQKIVVADDTFAFCGGIDATEDRWDTSEHLPHDPRRVRKDGSPAPPWHDATTALTGPIASALGDLSRQRWARATGESLDGPGHSNVIPWPDDLEVGVRDVNVAIARTEPPFEGRPLVNEIERLCLDQIAVAREHIYIESQYFAAASVCDALEARLQETDGPAIVIVNPQAALSTLEDKAMHVLRGRMIARLEAADPGGRFRIFHPVTSDGGPIYVHAKVFIVDDRVLRIGSSNLNNRSLGFDTECDVAFESEADSGDGKDDEVKKAIARFRARLLAEHMGVSEKVLAQAYARTGSLVAAIETLNPPKGRGLRRIEQLPEGIVGGWLADSRLLDARYRPGEATETGRGVRPRHVAIVVGLGLLGWLAWRAWLGRDAASDKGRTAQRQARSRDRP